MSIRGKLGWSFFSLLLITAIIAFFGIYFIVRINSENSYVQNFPSFRYNILNHMSTEIMDARRMVVMMAHHAGNEAELNRVYNEFMALRAGTRPLLDAYAQNFQDDPRIYGERRDDGIHFAAELDRRVMRYIVEVVDPMIDVAMNDPNNNAEISRLLDLGVEIHATIESLYNALMIAAQETVEDINAQVENLGGTATIIMIILTVVGIILSIVVAMLISKSISGPVQEVAEVLSEVANGNFNINIKSNLAKDEIGIMTRDVYSLINVVKSLVDDIEKFSYESTVNGDVDYRINAAKYRGSYNRMTVSLNGFIDNVNKDVEDLLATLMSINKGNFKVELRKLPGKKVVLNQTSEALLANLNAISAEVSKMIKSAVSGDLSAKIDDKQFEGDWRKLMFGLNQVTKAVNKPITEINDIMSRLSQGDFSTKVKGNYHGDFSAMSQAVNNTITSLSGYVSEMDEILSSISNGDLTRTISREYVGEFGEIKNSINNISGNLNKTMGEIASASEQVLTGAKQISSSAMDLANGANTQASSVQELNASVEMINQQTRQNADNANTANTLSNTSTSNARVGNDAMGQLMEAMTQIKESSNSISQIIKTIQDIAFQTNLLSLNASVEAARAGDHGKGFSVVADEVRSLASRSQSAVKETEEMIATAISRVEVGSEIAQTTSESLNAIVSSATEVLAIINKIASSSIDQAEAIEQVSQGLQQISNIVQSNSAVSEEAAAASEELTSQAEVMRELVGHFKL
ncbi:MAG: methyl-accepting chemotaxis protein [Defluviitaleaceae bacterium]|nr:methyl-accepting chemotaxis protein [Defluviitaleaceae bacterium]